MRILQIKLRMPRIFMEKVIYKDLSYQITGLLFKTHKEIGRFRNEKQYADFFENLLKENGVKYIREYELC